ncbi:TPA: hypothetical protein ACGYTK_003135, partial [Enterococcus faecium]
KKKALSIGTVRIKHFLAQKLALGTLWGVVVRKQNSLPRPPVVPNSKFFSKIFQRFRSAKSQAILTLPF